MVVSHRLKKSRFLCPTQMDYLEESLVQEFLHLSGCTISADVCVERSVVGRATMGDQVG